MPLPAPIDTLSDDEVQNGVPAAPEQARHRARAPRKAKSYQQELEVAAEQRRGFQVALSRSCKCKDPQCKRSISEDLTSAEAIFQQRLLIRELPKQEADQEVADLSLESFCKGYS